MLPDKSIKCHRTGFTKSCFDGVTKCKCMLWVRVDGLDAMGREIDVHGCADILSIKFLHEIAKEVRQGAASTDKVATEVRKSSDEAAARDVHLINGLKASFPVLQLVASNGQGLLLEDDSGDG
jgi:hypothetical protein